MGGWVGGWVGAAHSRPEYVCYVTMVHLEDVYVQYANIYIYMRGERGTEGGGQRRGGGGVGGERYPAAHHEVTSVELVNNEVAMRAALAILLFPAFCV